MLRGIEVSGATTSAAGSQNESLARVTSRLLRREAPALPSHFISDGMRAGGRWTHHRLDGQPKRASTKMLPRGCRLLLGVCQSHFGAERPLPIT